MAETAVPGARVKVRFAGQDLDGFVVDRRREAEHEGRLTPIRRVVSPEPVLTPDPAAASPPRSPTAVPARSATCCGWPCPPRHAAAEKALAARAADARPAARAGRPRARVEPVCRRAGLPARLAAGRVTGRVVAGPADGVTRARTGRRRWPLPPRATAGRRPGQRARGARPPRRRPGRRRAHRGCSARAGTSGSPPTRGRRPATRPGSRCCAGTCPVVVGTRAAAFAPVRDLGLVAWWDDGDDLLDEPRAPYPHVRDVLLTRAAVEGAALLSGGFTRTAAVQAPRRVRRAARSHRRRRGPRGAVPRVQVAGEGVEVERDAAAASRPPAVDRLAHGQGRPRVRPGAGPGAAPRLPARRCPARPAAPPCAAPHCGGPVGARPRGGPSRPAAGAVAAVGRFECRHCGGRELRSSVVGARRTAEELGRAFPGVPGAHLGRRRGPRAGRRRRRPWSSRPPAPSRWPTAAMPRACCSTRWASLDRPTLDAGEEALRRWPAAGALTRGGRGRRAGGALRRAHAHHAAGRRGAGALGPGLVRRARAGRPRASWPCPRPSPWPR